MNSLLLGKLYMNYPINANRRTGGGDCDCRSRRIGVPAAVLNLDHTAVCVLLRPGGCNIIL